jgi:hypothetical protein
MDYSLPSRDLFSRMSPCACAHVIHQQLAGAPYTLSWSFYNSGTRVLRFGFVSGHDFRMSVMAQRRREPPLSCFVLGHTLQAAGKVIFGDPGEIIRPLGPEVRFSRHLGRSSLFRPLRIRHRRRENLRNARLFPEPPLWCFVSGHDFSRAIKGQKKWALAPGLFALAQSSLCTSIYDPTKSRALIQTIRASAPNDAGPSEGPHSWRLSALLFPQCLQRIEAGSPVRRQPCCRQAHQQQNPRHGREGNRIGWPDPVQHPRQQSGHHG